MVVCKHFFRKCKYCDCFVYDAVCFNSRTYSPTSISVTNASCFNLNMTGGNVFMNANSLLYFYTDSDLSTTYSGARVVLWPGGGLSTSTDWYGFGINGNTLVYNVPTSSIHSFQVNGTQSCYVNAAGLVMNGNKISFSNNGAGLSWGNNYSQIYDNGNLYIVTDDYMNISAPTQLIVSSPNTSFSGNVYMGSNLLASQSWVTSQNYLTAVPSAISCTSITMTSPLTCTNPASPASWSQIGYLIT